METEACKQNVRVSVILFVFQEWVIGQSPNPQLGAPVVCHRGFSFLSTHNYVASIFKRVGGEGESSKSPKAVWSVTNIVVKLL